jgi:DNA (cytosine-5)-methyltransferase 1
MDISKMTKTELLENCKELGITKCKSKTKTELCKLIEQHTTINNIIVDVEQEIIENNIPPSSSNYTFIDLFCGIGGFHQALSKLGAKCVLACDIDKDCRTVYKDNYGIDPVSNIKDIDEKNMVDFDIICGGFPCFVAGTPTLTNSGYKNIEDVKITDKLLTHTGKFQDILNLQQKKYTGDLFDIKIKYHSEVVVSTEEHPFYIREKKGKDSFGEPIWKKANELTMNDYFGMVINNNEIIPEFTFEKKFNKNKTEQIHIKLDQLDYWFVMGYFVGDGWIEENNKINFTTNLDADNDSFERINKVIPIKQTDFNNNDFVWYNIFKQFGKCRPNKIIPEWVQDAPKEFIQEFINGYVKSNENVSLNLAYALQRLYLKLGHIFSVNKCARRNTYTEGRIVNQRDTYCIRGILKKEIKTAAFIENNYVWYPPVEITKRETTNTMVYNFEVENDNSYVVENICVHNCQAFSNGGNKKCFDDERGLLFDEIIRIAKVKKPKFMFLENVKHILKVSNGEVIEYIKKKIAMTGYHLQIFQMSPHNYGIPQQRERVYFVCIRNDIYDGTDITLPIYEGAIDFQRFLDKKEDVAQKYFIDGDTLNTLEAWDEMIKKIEIGEKISPTILINDAYKSYTQQEFDNFPDWKQEYITKNKPLIQKYKTEFDEWYKKHSAKLQKREIYGKLEWQTGNIKPNDSIFNYFIQFRQSGIRVKKAQYFPTLVAISQIPIYGKEKRYITPRECARLQSFPETFKLSPSDKVSYKQMGNSVNVDNVHTVISSTFKKYT